MRDIDPACSKLLLQPVQRQMRRLADPFQDEGAMRFQHALAVSADLAGRHRAGRTIALRPLHHRRYRNAKSRRHRAAALAANDCRNNTLSQIIGKRSGHRMLAPNPSQHLESQSTSQRNPSRFHQSVKRSRRSQLFQPKAILSSTRAPNFSDERATVLPPSAR